MTSFSTELKTSILSLTIFLSVKLSICLLIALIENLKMSIHCQIGCFRLPKGTGWHKKKDTWLIWLHQPLKHTQHRRIQLQYLFNITIYVINYYYYWYIILSVAFFWAPVRQSSGTRPSKKQWTENPNQRSVRKLKKRASFF